MSLQDSLDRISKGQHSLGHQQDVEDAVVNSYKQMFGRDPSQQEFSQALPAFDTSANAGLSFLAQSQQQQQNSPEGQQAADLAKYNADPNKWNDQINSLFKTSLNRDASDAEKQHFGSLLASGKIDSYGLNQFVQGLPEYGQAQDKAFQDSQRSGLEAADTKYYTDQLLPQIQSQMASQGRSLDSSGYSAMLAQAAKQQADSRNSYLSQLSASQYAGRTGQAQTDYQNYLNGLTQNQQRNYQTQDALTSRTNQYADYNAQRDAYNQYLAQYGKRQNNGLGSLVGGSIGTGLGAYLGGTEGAKVGYQAGSGVGGAAQSQWG